MAWEKRGERNYYYRAARLSGQVRKAYFGTGPVAVLAAGEDALYRAEQNAEADRRRQKRNRLDAAVAVNRKMTEACNLLATATLLVAGYHRPSRHFWRRWRNGCKETR
jgi:hypothetical protein